MARRSSSACYPGASGGLSISYVAERTPLDPADDGAARELVMALSRPRLPFERRRALAYWHAEFASIRVALLALYDDGS